MEGKQVSEDTTEEHIQKALLNNEVTLALTCIEIVALKHCVEALEALQKADIHTSNGIGSDYLDRAADEIRKAMRMMGA